MKLVGTWKSPYVRRVGIALHLLGLRFELQSLSAWSDFGDLQRINPVVKVPTLVCDDGTVLLDSTLILQYAEALVRPRSLLPVGLGELRHDLRLAGLALAGCDKSVQLFWETTLRPPDTVHEPFATRYAGQALAAFDELERELARRPPLVESASLPPGVITAAVAWRFAHMTLPAVLPADRFPQLVGLSTAAEALPSFLATAPV